MAQPNPDLMKLAAEIAKWRSENTVRQALLNSFDEMEDRIFERGEDSAGGLIGQISTTPGYFNPKDFPKKSGFTGRGKTGKNTFKDGRKHVTTYFQDGYKGAKQAAGRDPKVDMYLTGDLKRNFLPEMQGGKAVIGYATDFARDKGEGNEERFHTDIFSPTEKEIGIFIDALLSE